MPHYVAARKHVRAGKGDSERYHERVLDYLNDAATQMSWSVFLFAAITGLVIRQIDAGDRGPVTNLKNSRRCTLFSYGEGGSTPRSWPPGTARGGLPGEVGRGVPAPASPDVAEVKNARPAD
jgi:hypothetical protein